MPNASAILRAIVAVGVLFLVLPWAQAGPFMPRRLRSPIPRLPRKMCRSL